MINKPQIILNKAKLDTPLGSMLAIADKNALYLLEFDNGRSLEREIENLRTKMQATFISGYSSPIHSIEIELRAYFEGSLKEFKTPLYMLGSPFQRLVWNELRTIPYGQTRSYRDQAIAIGKKAAYRAVANANGANQIAIVIPCHRIINSNGNLGGYGGGVPRKKWLIDHEKRYS